MEEEFFDTKGNTMKQVKKIVHIIGGGTRFHIDSHLYLGSKAFGNTAKVIAELCKKRKEMDVKLHLTAMAAHTVKTDPEDELPAPYTGRGWHYNQLDTNEDLKKHVENIVKDPRTKIIFFTAAVVDFDGKVD